MGAHFNKLFYKKKVYIKYILSLNIKYILLLSICIIFKNSLLYMRIRLHMYNLNHLNILI